MNLFSWEATIQQIADETNHEPKEAAKQRLLMAWRSKLEKEPNSVPLRYVDDIVREVRKRLIVAL